MGNASATASPKESARRDAICSRPESNPRRDIPGAPASDVRWRFDAGGRRAALTWHYAEPGTGWGQNEEWYPSDFCGNALP